MTGQNINTKTSSYWIGFSNLDNKGFSWIDGSNVNFTNWDTNQPDNYNKVEECGAIVRTGKWNDVICYTGRGWLCKIPKGIVPPTTPIVVNDTFTGKKLIFFKRSLFFLFLIQVTQCENSGDSKINWVQYRDKCYYASPAASLEWLSWSSAEAFCKQEGGFLVSMHSVNDMRFILSRVSIIIFSILLRLILKK